jgi:uncharacterized protein YjbJ (UPF0337 family)
MGRKSSRQDRGEGAMDKAKGRCKEAVDALTSDEKEGRGALGSEQGHRQREVG